MQKIHIKLQTKITILVIIIVFLSIATATLYTSRWYLNNIKLEVEKNVLNTAQLLARTPIVIERLKNPTGNNELQPFVMDVLRSTKEIDIIVVADMNGIRHAHPVEERLGFRVVGGDDNDVLEFGKSYTSYATGTLGSQVRAFTPVYDSDGKQLGYTLVGVLTTTMDLARRQIIRTVMLAALLALVLGSTGAFFLARSIKKVLFGQEPEEIAKMYLEKEGILETIHEGIIAIDENRKITLINNSAIEILGIKSLENIGKQIDDVVPNSRLRFVLETGIPEYDKEQVVNGAVIITNRVPIYDGDKLVGALATFKDKTDVIILAEELTGVRQLVDGLRANTHEFMNKLHVILGLIELNELQEAKKYIVNVDSIQNQIITMIIGKIKEPKVAGLLIGKLSRAKELGIDMVVENDTYLDKMKDEIMSNRMLTIIGNLIENAMDALNSKSNDGKSIHIRIKEVENEIKIKVRDNGVGIDDSDLDNIFNRGYSTKEGNRGLGLTLIKENLDTIGGMINVQSVKGMFTEFNATIPKEVLDDKLTHS
ncbi:MAG: ATP-binding protein [Eubacteriales bacterium]|nr:ATP-binding protein [Eubacteriales bacterium]